MPLNLFRPGQAASATPDSSATGTTLHNTAASTQPAPLSGISATATYVPSVPAPARTHDAVSSLFGLDTDDLEEHFPLPEEEASMYKGPEAVFVPPASSSAPIPPSVSPTVSAAAPTAARNLPDAPVSPPAAVNQSGESGLAYTIRIQGPGLDTHLTVQDVDDLDIVEAFLKQIRRRLSA